VEATIHKPKTNTYFGKKKIPWSTSSSSISWRFYKSMPHRGRVWRPIPVIQYQCVDNLTAKDTSPPPKIIADTIKFLIGHFTTAAIAFHTDLLSNPPYSPFVKRGKCFSSLWQREVGRDFRKFISNGSCISFKDLADHHSITCPFKKNRPVLFINALMFPGKIVLRDTVEEVRSYPVFFNWNFDANPDVWVFKYSVLEWVDLAHFLSPPPFYFSP
jgi:hypothetical protein